MRYCVCLFVLTTGRSLQLWLQADTCTICFCQQAFQKNTIYSHFPPGCVLPDLWRTLAHLKHDYFLKKKFFLLYYMVVRIGCLWGKKRSCLKLKAWILPPFVSLSLCLPVSSQTFLSLGPLVMIGEMRRQSWRAVAATQPSLFRLIWILEVDTRWLTYNTTNGGVYTIEGKASFIGSDHNSLSTDPHH